LSAHLTKTLMAGKLSMFIYWVFLVYDLVLLVVESLGWRILNHVCDLFMPLIMLGLVLTVVIDDGESHPCEEISGCGGDVMLP
jgi:hypothetical protein